MGKLHRILIIIAAIIVVSLASVCMTQRRTLASRAAEIQRLSDNQSTLLSQVEYYESENGELVASVQALSLKRDELSALIPEYENEIKNLRLELKNIRTFGHIEMEMFINATAPIQIDSVPDDIQSVPASQPIVPEERHMDFSWRDNWTDLRGRIYADSVACSLSCRDTLTLVAHYSKRKCLFKKKGRLLKYDVKSRNPHVTVSNMEIVEVVE